MATTIATRTLRAFEEKVAADGGNAFRMWQGRVMPTLPDAYRQDEDKFRSHLGASSIGRDCARELWYGFRWSTESKASGRMLRLWNRGHLEEGRMVALLLTIGCEVFQQDEHGKQYRISAAGGHYGGSGDGVFKGCPDLPPDTPALSEFKTHNLKSFAKLAGANWDAWHDYHVLGHTQGVRKVPEFEGAGVRSAKFEHWVQMQQYMSRMGLAVGVYFATCKNDDHVYAEVVTLDQESAEKYTQRGAAIVEMHEPPNRISESPGWFGCKFCDHRMVCHYGAAPARNCRTCEWSHPDTWQGGWNCWHPDNRRSDGTAMPIDKQEQLAACSMWVKHSKAFK